MRNPFPVKELSCVLKDNKPGLLPFGRLILLRTALAVVDVPKRTFPRRVHSYGSSVCGPPSGRHRTLAESHRPTDILTSMCSSSLLAVSIHRSGEALLTKGQNSVDRGGHTWQAPPP